MSTSGLSAPGSSTYDTDNMYVGDGTWDSQRNTFLLPNLMGLNFAVMQYNGMGNRFKNLTGYHALVRGHGIMAGVTFLLIVPAAILFARFYHRNPRLALRLHIWLQIVTVAFTTVVFILGWFAVGPSRSLSNPHHGIGLALYILILVQAIGGALIHHIEKKKERYKLPLKLMLHQWLGRAIALLGIAQIPLGLTLYGSPKALFVLFALWGFLLLIVYFVLSYRNQPEIGIDDAGSYVVSRSDLHDDRRSHHRPGLGAIAAAGAAGAGLAALRRRSRSRRRDSRTDLTSRRSSRPPSGSYLDEKYTDDGRRERDHTWRNRLFGAAAGVGVLAGLKSLFGRGRAHDEESSVGTYSNVGGTQIPSQTDLSRIEEGRAPESPFRRGDVRAGVHSAVTGSPTRSAARPSTRRRRSGESLDSYDSRTSVSRDEGPRGGYGLMSGIAALGVAGFLREKFKARQRGREEHHVEELRRHEERESERINRATSRRRRGNGFPRPGRRLPSMTESSVSAAAPLGNPAIMGSNPELSRHTLPPPAPRASGRLQASDVSALGSRANLDGSRPGTGVPPPPLGASVSITPSSRPGTATAPAPASAAPGSVQMPPAPPDPQGILHQESSASDIYSAGGGRHPRSIAAEASIPAALVAGAAGGASAAASQRRDTSQQRSVAEASVATQPVSVKVKMHNDGRHVTLRRLNEEEAAAEREARRRERHRRHRAGSLSSVGGVGDDRWRRVEAREAAQAQAQQEAAAAAAAAPSSVAPPPSLPPPSLSVSPSAPPHGSQSTLTQPIPMPAGTSLLGGSAAISPPGTAPYAETGTDVSAYDSNRRRRRAERAQAKLAARGQSGSRVEFT